MSLGPKGADGWCRVTSSYFKLWTDSPAQLSFPPDVSQSFPHTSQPPPEQSSLLISQDEFSVQVSNFFCWSFGYFNDKCYLQVQADMDLNYYQLASMLTGYHELSELMNRFPQASILLYASLVNVFLFFKWSESTILFKKFVVLLFFFVIPVTKQFCEASVKC